MSMQRRDFLKHSAGAAITGLCMADRPLVAAEASLPIIDTHQHLWDFARYRSPWLDQADPVIARRHTTNDYLLATRGLNVTQAVYMEVDVAPADQVTEAEYVLELCKSENHPTVAAVISGRPNSDSFATYVSRYKDNQYIKGVRQVLQVPEAERGLCLQPQFVKSMQLLGQLGKSFDLCMRPTELADGATLARSCPDTRFIVDHCGNADPKAWLPSSSEEPWHTVDIWKRGLETLAKQTNVICKISGIVARAPQGWQPELLAPIVNFCLDVFGPYRVMFGGDWPVCKLGATFAEWVHALQAIVGERPLFEQRMLFRDNARAFYALA
jgi:predicted TIM-barrel fold metal-dependent hydrolase